MQTDAHQFDLEREKFHHWIAALEPPQIVLILKDLDLILAYKIEKIRFFEYIRKQMEA